MLPGEQHKLLGEQHKLLGWQHKLLGWQQKSYRGLRNFTLPFGIKNIIVAFILFISRLIAPLSCALKYFRSEKLK
jgi:hypothetical protein